MRTVDIVAPLAVGIIFALALARVGVGLTALESVPVLVLGCLLRRDPFRISVLVIAPTAIPAVGFAAFQSLSLLALAVIATIAGTLLFWLLALAGQLIAEERVSRAKPIP